VTVGAVVPLFALLAIAALVAGCEVSREPIGVGDPGLSVDLDNATPREYVLQYTQKSEAGDFDYAYVIPAESAGRVHSQLGLHPGRWRLLDLGCSPVQELGVAINSDYLLVIQAEGDIAFGPRNRTVQPRGSPMPEAGEACTSF
jgi:hypothetical protein